MALQHLRSSTASKRPTPAAMSDGQLAINTNTASPGLFFKDSAGALIKVGPVHVGTTAPNATPASGGATGNTVGEQWLDTTGGGYVFKVWDGSAWRSETGEFVNVNGDTMTGDLVMNNANIVFEGATADDFETTLTVTDPTADRTITLPDVSGTVVTTGDTGSVTSTMIADGAIVDADINASAEIAVSKLADGTARQLLQTDAAGTGVEWTSNIDVPGTLDVTGAAVFDSSITAVGDVTLNAQADLRFADSDSSNWVALQAPATVASNVTWTLPDADGTSGQVLSTDGAGALSWTSSAGSGDKIEEGNTSVEVIDTGSDGRVVFTTEGNEVGRFDSSGRLGLGTSTPQYNLHGTGYIGLGTQASSGAGAGVHMIPSSTLTNWFVGANYVTSGAFQIIPSTAGGGSTFTTPAFTIDSSSRVGVGSTVPPYRLTVKDTADQIHITNPTAGDANSDGFTIGLSGSDAQLINRENGAIILYQNSGEAARIDSSKRLLVGTTTAPSNGGGGFAVMNDGGSKTYLRNSATVTTTWQHFQFHNANGDVGTITTNGSATAYNTSSDYRLKENVVPLVGAADRLNQLQVHRFNFIADPDTTVDGFLAHEVQTVVPEAITGEKDAVDDGGNPIYQGIDQSKLVPLLTAALQEAIGEIESLKARVAALETP